MYAPYRASSPSLFRRSSIAVCGALVVCALGLIAYSSSSSSLLSSPAAMRAIRAPSARTRCNAAVGDVAPAFSLSSESGKKVSLESLKGPFGLEQFSKPAVVFFYGGQGSPSCTKEVQAFRDAYPEFKAMGAEVLGISRDTADFSSSWKAENEVPFPLLSDVDGSVRESYGINKDLFGLLDGRETYVVGKDGKIAMKFNSQFEPEKHVEKALAALAEI